MSKIKFNGKTIYTKSVVRNIKQLFDASSKEGLYWYDEANEYAQYISDKYNVPKIKVCGIIAAVSPLKSWDINKRIVNEFYTDGTIKHTKVFQSKVRRIHSLSDEDTNAESISMILSGSKIVSFFINIYDPNKEKTVTVDRHAISIAVNKSLSDEELRITKKQYEFFANCYNIAAIDLNIRVSQLQSVTWVHWRQNKNNNK